MPNNKSYCIKWPAFILLMCICSFSVAQENKTNFILEKQKGLSSLVVSAGGGISFYTASVGTPPDLNAHIYRIHPAGSLRIMWHPGHLLQIGLESGLTDFYSYRVHNGVTGKVVVRAVPLLLVFSMPILKRIHVATGPGVYFITSKLSYEGYVSSSAYNLGWMLAASYEYPINDKLGVAGELKWLDVPATRDASIIIQIKLQWKFLSW